MYSLDQFASMFADRLRMDAYTTAIARTVKPGDSVVDLGCGPGIFALLACKAGARRVYAIDTSGVVDFGRHLAAVNGFSDRLHFLRGDSRQIHLPERVQVIVADVRGVLPLFSHAVGTLEDARQRFLTEGGSLLPSQDTLVTAVVELPEQYEHITHAWRAVPPLDLSSGLPLVLNTVYRQQLKPRNVLSEPRAWHVLDYTKPPGGAAQAVVELQAARAGVGHGVGLWFETQLQPGIGYSTKPQESETVYGHIFLPWLEPVALSEGETVRLDLRAHLVGSDYVWQWETHLPAAPGRDEKLFKQSTFYGSLFPPSLLQKRTMGFVPVLNESGQAERWLYQAMDGKRALAEIAGEAARMFPHVFRREEDAFNRAAEIAEKFSR
ncbi:MAG TPA: 50S ribosomal protein L11 methyltransferase [Dongiaceae bacterium]|nr:50S ribosomal protein L11 methyltransferase [Dongiaceae bacterium]